MKTAAPKRKWPKILLTLLVILLAAGGGLYYILKYRFREVIQVVVDKESKGVYGFDAAAIEISFLEKHIVISNAVLFCRDTLNSSPHYHVKIPRLYLGIQSWQDLLLHKKIIVDSLSVIEPAISVHEHFTQKARPIAFQASRITDQIEKLLQQLQVHSLDIENASFVSSTLNNPVPLTVSSIHFSVRNFSKNAANSDRLFSSDDIDLSIGAQHWVLPGGKQDIRFNRLHFSGRDQFFELDSCTFHKAAADDKDELSLHADKLFFNSKQLAALYEQDALLLDTLICYRPVLNVVTTREKTLGKDSTAAVSRSIGQFFSNIHIGYIDIKDGELYIVNKYNPNYQTQKANLRAYNLNISQQGNPQLTTDSIRLNLKNLSFLTTDSLFELSVNEFILDNKEVVFKNAVYAATARNHADKGFLFSAPSLRLRNISLAALMNKKIMADTAELNAPVITVFDKTGKTTSKGDDSTGLLPKKNPANKKSFYQTLHGLSELIAVKHFNILNGSLGFSASGKAPMKMAMKDLNASILLDKLFRSDSLIDIKRSLPRVSASLVTVEAPGASLSIAGYDFKGDRRHSRADEFKLSLANGTSISGRQLYWEVFDWDLYANHKIIQVDYLKLHELTVDLRKKSQPETEPSKSKKDLPVLHVARLDMDLLHFNASSGTNRVGFEASAICADNIGSQKQFFTWNNAEGMFTNLFVNGVNRKYVTVGKISLNTQYETVLQNAIVDINDERGYTRVNIPLAKLKTAIHSTDFAAAQLQSLEADNAVVDLYKKQPRPNSTIIQKPANTLPALGLNRLLIKKASLHYTGETAKDTLSFNAGISIEAADISTGKQPPALFNYGKLAIGLSDLTVNKGRIDLSIPQASLTLVNGTAAKNTAGKLMLRSGISLQWQGAAIQLKQTDSAGIAASHIAGSFDDAGFQFNAGSKIDWQPLIGKAVISNGRGTYTGKNITATAGAIAWNPSKDMLSIRSFTVLPKLSMKETFGMPAAWQGDYMTIEGESADISGIRFRQQEGDSMLQIKKIALDSISLTTTRDKRMPFKHGAEKPMPVVMINAIKMPLQADSIVISRSSVTVNEIAIKSEKQGTIPLTSIDAVITNFKNRSNAKDSLTIVANARLLKYKVSNFYYKEAYGDSLSYFFAAVHVSSMALPGFSAVTVPLASIGVDNGNADTLFAHWAGNKYAAVGRMDFYYKGLKIRLLDAKDNTKRNFLLVMGTKVAGLILHKNNDASSQMFFVRDREKFIFNYWVKTLLAGLSTSAGIKRNKKMMKQYRKTKTLYSLPVVYD